jgi:hypothetical protein
MDMSQEVSTELCKHRLSDIPTASAQQMQINIYLKKNTSYDFYQKY